MSGDQLTLGVTFGIINPLNKSQYALNFINTIVEHVNIILINMHTELQKKHYSLALFGKQWRMVDKIADS